MDAGGNVYFPKVVDFKAAISVTNSIPPATVAAIFSLSDLCGSDSRIEIEQHHHKEEQYHDGSSIYYDMRDGQELRIQQDIVAGDRKKTNDQGKHTVHGMFWKRPRQVH